MIHVDVRPFEDPDSQRLVAALLADLAERYGEGDGAPPTNAEDFAEPHGTFLVATLDARAVGCGGFRRHDARSAEIKRMYVAPEIRGRGVARRLLAELERAARARGYGELRLGTGLSQPEAIALYASAGYEPIPGFGYYARFRDARFFAKQL